MPRCRKIARISSSTGAVTLGGAATITLTLSDPGVLTLADIVVTGGTVSGFSGSGTSYTLLVTPPANSTTPITVSVGGSLFSDAAGNPNSAAAPLVVAVNTNTPILPGTPSTVDGVEIRTQSGTDARTGLATRTVSVPTITSTRPEDSTTSHPNLADIPLGIAANGAVLQMFNHGLSAAAMFFLVGVVYERAHTRDLNELGGGIWQLAPVYGGLLIFSSMASLGLPGLGGFVAEFAIVRGAWPVFTVATAFSMLGLFFTGAYILKGVQQVLHGKLRSNSRTED